MCLNAARMIVFLYFEYYYFRTLIFGVFILRIRRLNKENFSILNKWYSKCQNTIISDSGVVGVVFQFDRINNRKLLRATMLNYIKYNTYVDFKI